MNLLEYSFSYNPAYLQSVQGMGILGNITMIVLLAIGFSLLIGAYVIAPYVYGYFVIGQKEREKGAKKRIIQDLIVMKEIQTELEVEMEQAFLNAALAKHA